MTNICTKTNDKLQLDYIDKMIDLETERKLSIVIEAKKYGVMTACFIDGEFQCISNYEISKDLYEKLKNA